MLLKAASQRASHVTGGTHVATECAQRVSPDNSASTKKENGMAWLLRGEHYVSHYVTPFAQHFVEERVVVVVVIIIVSRSRSLWRRRNRLCGYRRC